MNMRPIDWSIVAALLALLFFAALATLRYTRSVSAFLAAERCGRRYLIALALAMAGTGVTTLVYWFEIYYEAGFSGYWWNSMTEPALIVIALSGWVAYRFRQTRALTLAQFFEMRYSRNFRVFAGLLAFFAGVINFGIYPAVGARFFIALCGLPDHFDVGGGHVSMFVALMVLLLSIALLFTYLGGQLAVMVTDFLQGAFANVVFVALTVFLLVWIFPWDRIEWTMLHADPGKSPFHPLHMSGQKDFNLSFFLIAVFIVFYTFNAWQGTSGYNSCALNAHEAKMAGLLYGWRFRVLLTFTILIPIGVMTLLHHPDYAKQGAALEHRLASVKAEDLDQERTLRNELRLPYALSILLPSGLLGLIVAAALAAFISTNGTCLHSWGTIFVQDVVLPFRRAPLSPMAHLRLLRLSIAAVAVFALMFSLVIKPMQYLPMFFSITAAVFVGGAGSAIIGGLYWKRGSTHAAWAAMLTGMLLSTLGILLTQLEESSLRAWFAFAPALRDAALFVHAHITGQEQTFITMCAASIVYVLVSLLGPRQVTNMDKLLRRGRYAKMRKTRSAVEPAAADPGHCRTCGYLLRGLPDPRCPECGTAFDPNAHVAAPAVTEPSVLASSPPGWLERLGIDREFTRGDRWVAYVSVGWPLAWSVLFVVVTIWNLFQPFSDAWWLRFWHIWIWVFTAGAAVVTLWFTIGGYFDLRFLFQRLRSIKPDHSDDGRVITD